MVIQVVSVDPAVFSTWMHILAASQIYNETFGAHMSYLSSPSFDFHTKERGNDSMSQQPTKGPESSKLTRYKGKHHIDPFFHNYSLEKHT